MWTLNDNAKENNDFMAIFHLDALVIHKTHSHPGAAGLSQYLRSGVGSLRQYMERADPGREDLVEYGEAGLPSWAQHGTHFFAMANQFEARKDGVVARHYQFTLPRELSEEGRLALAQDMREVFFARYPHAYAIHNPQAKDRSGDQPHMHVLMSPRRDDGVERTPRSGLRGWVPMTGTRKTAGYLSIPSGRRNGPSRGCVMRPPS